MNLFRIPVVFLMALGAEAPLLEAEKADRGLVINNRNVVELPLNIRNPIMLAALTPGIQAIGTTLDLNPFSNSGISSWSVNGSNSKTTDFLLDGAPNNAVYNQENTVAYVPPIEAVPEFKVMTSTYDAQYGRSGGGTVNVSLKSGTNFSKVFRDIGQTNLPRNIQLGIRFIF